MTVQDRVQLISDNTNLNLNTKITTAKIEITGVCTFKCHFCYQNIMIAKNERQKFMTDTEFNQVLEYLKLYPDLKEVGLFYMGESGLHPNLAQYYKQLKKLGYFTYLTTNGTCLESVKQAIPYIDSLKVSFNYLLNGSNDIHEITRTNYIPITKIIDNINIFAKECKKYNTEFALSTVIDESKYNKESHSKTMDYLFPNIFHYYIPLQTQGGYNNKGLGGVVGETESKVNQIPCWSLFKGLYIDADLNVRTCCYGHTDKHILGNIKDMKVVNKKELLQQHLSNQIPDICKECIKNK